MGNPVQLQGFPVISDRFVDERGYITQAWRQFLVGLWRLTGGGQNNGVFVTGDLKLSATAQAQLGWLVCDGSAVSRTVYATLYATIGDTWGAGDGVTTFNLPDLTHRAPIGADTTPGYEVGDTGGSDALALTPSMLPAHNHAVNDPGHSHGVSDPGHVHGVTDPGHVHSAAAAGGDAVGPGTDGATAGSTGSATTGVTVNSATTGVGVNNATTGVTTANAGAGDPVPLQPPYAAVAYLIKT